MKKVIDEIKKHKKAMIGVAVVVVIFAWIMTVMEGLACSDTSEDGSGNTRNIFLIHMNHLNPLSTF